MFLFILNYSIFTSLYIFVYEVGREAPQHLAVSVLKKKKKGRSFGILSCRTWLFSSSKIIREENGKMGKDSEFGQWKKSRGRVWGKVSEDKGKNQKV